MKKNIIKMMAAVGLILAIGVSGTLAYLTSTTETVSNTFTMGKVSIELTEATGEDNDYTYHVSPGEEVDKDPTIIVHAASEESYLFVKVEKGSDLDAYIEYDMASGWTELKEGLGVYYYNSTVGGTNTDVTYEVLSNNVVTVKTEVTGIADNAEVTMNFTAYAIQASGFENAADAWAAL